MLRFYILNRKMQTVSAQLSWSHYCELISLNNINKINYYVKISEEENLSVRKLRERIKNNEYERLDDRTKIKLSSKKKTDAHDFIKNPILIRFDTDKLSEKMLKQSVLKDLSHFLNEFGCIYRMGISDKAR